MKNTARLSQLLSTLDHVHTFDVQGSFVEVEGEVSLVVLASKAQQNQCNKLQLPNLHLKLETVVSVNIWNLNCPATKQKPWSALTLEHGIPWAQWSFSEPSLSVFLLHLAPFIFQFVSSICFQFVFRVSVCLGSTLSSLPFSKAATSVGVAEKKAMRKGFSVFSKGAKASAWGSQRVTQWGTRRGDLGPGIF